MLFDCETFVSHLECSETGEHYPADQIANLSRAGKPLFVRYDLDRLGRAVTPELLKTRLPEFWRYREFLPVRHKENIVRLGEVMTPLLNARFLEQSLGQREVIVKDEGRLPTGSFKARGLALAVSMARELGISRMAIPTNGNAGAALAAYCSQAGIESYVFCPDDTPDINIREIALLGASTYTAAGLINDCGRFVTAGIEKAGWFDTSTLKEPYRIEGKKTMGLELAEQYDWELPDVILYPTGGGTGLIGMWKAFAELKEIGWLTGKLPRMVSVQASGCAPIVDAWECDLTHAEPWQNAHTVAAGIRVPAAIGDFLILNAIRESNGFAIAVDDDDIVATQRDIAQKDGLLLCPEGAATATALIQARERKLIDPDERVVLFNCATGLKYPMPDDSQSMSLANPPAYRDIVNRTE
ncbi:MAG: threonine synthase [Gammaproteobacteria bacterium]|uniref:Threonine synthase n=1 Tax=OM182 bacterium MED-G24 TaxID=1986255 RepID=A0A2A5WL03_9GAMM|nr:threonine synthase [Gammaproteobacteria bacterium]PDH37169.1 MAG: threonine synthase [OM182 bacterium MED-G24]RPG25236.1 MAG: threonine synthase [Gammaproteobacteria bacterium TMED50]|tara:strand:+ start:8366 stop:9604 length:1239 start_codon:yes stop_codon:yes gene_type:complete